MLLIIAAVACTPEEEKTGNLSIDFLEESVTVSGEGGKASIAFTSAGTEPMGNMDLTCTPSDPWLHDFNITDGKITFTVDPNESGESRSTIVEVSADGMTGKPSFIVIQEGKAPFKIVIEELGKNNVKGRVIPTDNALKYAFIMMSKSNYDMLGGDDESAVNTFIAECGLAAQYEGKALEEYMGNVLIAGEQTFNYDNLYAATTYVIIAAGMELDCSLTSGIVRSEFTTNDISESDISFTFEITPTKEPDTKIVIKASDDTTRFTYNFFTKDEVESSGVSIENMVQAKLDTYIVNGGLVGTNKYVVIDMNSYYGQMEVELDNLLMDETDYIVAACALTEDGKVNSFAGTQEFRTGKLEPSDNQFEIQVTEKGLDYVNLSISTTNDDPYYVMLAKAEDYEGMEADEILSYVTGRYIINANYEGNINLTKGSLAPGTEYLIGAFGYHNGARKATTGLTFITVSLDEKPGDASQLKFDISIDDVTTFSISYTVRPDPTTALYHTDIYPADMTGEQIKDQLYEDALNWVRNGSVETVADAMRFMGSRGTRSFSDEGLESGKDYRIGTVGIYDTNGDFATDVIFSDIITTEVRTVSDVEITVDYDKYFDGTELSKLYPEMRDAIGFAVVPLKATVSGDVKNIYYYLYSGNYADASAYPDDFVIEDLKSYGPCPAEHLFICYFDVDNTIIAVAEDSEGNFGPVFRKVINLDYNGSSPADEFSWPEETPNRTMSLTK